MSKLDWDALWAEFHRIVTLDQVERKAALAQLPDGQASEIKALLSAHDQDDSLLDRPVLLTNEVKPGLRIGPWELNSLLGEGGMGQVWLATRADGAYQREVAIKLLALGLPNAGLIERFTREREILARLDHPNIAGLIDGGTLDNGQPYLVMERVEGQDLLSYCSDKRLSVQQRLGLTRKICAAVDHAHRRLIIHRDLKPANILINESGEPKLLDFGIARLLDPEHQSEQTVAAERRLTLEYASPEQLRGEPADTRSDAFSLGVILFELLVGQRPWDSDGLPAAQLHQRVTGQSGARLSRTAATPELRRRLRGDLDWIVARAIETDPEQRYADARELGDEIQRVTDGFPVQARPPTRRYRLSRFIQRHPLGTATTVLIVGMSLVAGTALWMQSQALSRALVEAEKQTERAGALSNFLAELLIESDPEVHQGDPRTVEQVLSEAADRIEREFVDQPRLKAELSMTLAEISFSRGDYGKAQNLVDDGLILASSVGATTIETQVQAQLLNARLALVDGRYLDVLDQTRRLISDLAFSDLPSELSNQARVIQAEAFQAMDDLPAAARALGDLQAENEVGDAAIEAWFRQGGLHWGQGDFESAEASYRQALALQIQAYGESSLQAARGYNAIASVRYRQGDLAQADELFRQVMERQITILGADHPQTAETRVRLGALLYDRGAHEESIEQLRLALETQTATFGDSHIALANTHNNLGLALAAQQRFNEAEQHFQSALTINESVHGPIHSRVAGNLSNLGWMKIEQNQPLQAQALLLDALARQRQVFDGDHPQLGYTLHHLGRAALMSNDFDGARDWLNKALTTRQSLLAADHPALADTHLLLADERQARGDFAAAAQHLQIGLDIRDQRFGLNDRRRPALLKRLREVSDRIGQE